MASSSRAAPPAQPAGTYSAGHLQILQQQSRSASTRHLFAAADWVSAVFKANNIPFAFMGGFSLKIRGSTRDTYDIDVAVGCDMLRLIQVLTPQKRVLRPLGPVSGVMRIFVKTGGEFDAQLPESFVEVDLILRGSLGAPNQPEAVSEEVSVETSAGFRRYRILNLQSTMASKLGAASARSGQNDLDDVIYLITKYPDQVWSMRQQFNSSHRQHFINSLYRNGTAKSTITKAQGVLGIAGYVAL